MPPTALRNFKMGVDTGPAMLFKRFSLRGTHCFAALRGMNLSKLSGSKPGNTGWEPYCLGKSGGQPLDVFVFSILLFDN